MSTTKIVRLHRAERTAEIDVPELSIFAIDPVPRFAESGNFGAWHEEARGFYAIQAANLADGLFASLPGGTIDALLVEMLKRKASVLCIPMVEPAAPSVKMHRELSALAKLASWVNHAFGANAADRIIEGDPPKLAPMTEPGMSDSAYAALGQMVKTLMLEMASVGSSGVHDGILKAIDALSPTVGAEIRAYGAEDTYAKRW